MEITGWDLVLFTFEPPREIFTRVLGAVLKRWPEVMVEVCVESLSGTVVRGDRLSPEDLPEGKGILYFVRDSAMTAHAEKHAYAPMADGDGPFAIFSRVRSDVEFRCERLAELKVTDTPGRVGKVEPYPAWICTPLIHEITAVTPGDPETHPFSAWVLDITKRACMGEAEPEEGDPCP